MKKIIYLLLLMPFFGLSQATEPSNADAVFIKKLSDEILTNGKAYDLLYELTKKVGGRIAGSPAMYRAEAWGVNAFQQLGAPDHCNELTSEPDEFQLFQSAVDCLPLIQLFRQASGKSNVTERNCKEGKARYLLQAQPSYQGRTHSPTCDGERAR